MSWKCALKQKGCVLPYPQRMHLDFEGFIYFYGSFVYWIKANRFLIEPYCKGLKFGLFGLERGLVKQFTYPGN